MFIDAIIFTTIYTLSLIFTVLAVLYNIFTFQALFTSYIQIITLNALSTLISRDADSAIRYESTSVTSLIVQIESFHTLLAYLCRDAFLTTCDQIIT